MSLVSCVQLAGGGWFRKVRDHPKSRPICPALFVTIPCDWKPATRMNSGKPFTRSAMCSQSRSALRSFLLSLPHQSLNRC
jgi:hypothetical protein